MGAVAHLRSDAGAPRALVDMVFDAFDKGGAGRLAAWIALSGNLDQLEPVREAVAELVRALEEKFAHGEGRSAPRRHLRGALHRADGVRRSVIGEPLKDMLDRERTAARKVAAFLLPKFFL